MLGPPLGGFITTHFGWRWIFYLNVPLGAAAFVAALALVPHLFGDNRRPFDGVGFLLGGVGTFALLVGLERMTMRADIGGVALMLGGIALLVATIRHLRRAAAPLIDLAAYRIPTFRVSLLGGSLMRMAIGAAPFLLPLMFQAGFGYDAFHSGLLVLALFASNLAMKAGTTPVLRRWGYRPVLIGNGLLCAISLAVCACLTPETPTLVTVIIGGASRSMQFTTLSTLAFADVSGPEMSHANGLFNTVMQITSAAGITLAAIGVRVSPPLAHLVGITGAGAEYRAAFLLVATVALLGLVDATRLPADAGNHFLTRRK